MSTAGVVVVSWVEEPQPVFAPTARAQAVGRCTAVQHVVCKTLRQAAAGRGDAQDQEHVKPPPTTQATATATRASGGTRWYNTVRRVLRRNAQVRAQ